MNVHAQPRGTVSLRRFFSRFHSRLPSLILLACTLAIGAPALAETPAPGAQAADFTLLPPTGHSVSLVSETNTGTLLAIRAIHSIVSNPADAEDIMQEQR